MSHELSKQAELIEELDQDMDSSMKKMNFLQMKLGKLLKTNDMGQICTIVVLFLVLVAMLFLLICT